MTIQQPILNPIRFHDPSLEFDNETTFQNPDNRVSTGYDWENVKPVPYALPIPKQWPDGQPGIDCLFTLENGSAASDIYAKLYDANDADYLDCHVDLWTLIPGSPATPVARVWLNGMAGSTIEDGYYTVKIFQSSDDTLLLESEALLIAEWFVDTVPFEFWNFENDFGIYFDNGSDLKWTSRAMVPIRLYDSAPQFEKVTYKNDPGILTTLRTVPQRIYNLDSHPIPVHLAEYIQLGFACSELYLDRIKINAEEIPDAENYEGTNLKYISGQATFVDFNDNYWRERVEKVQEDQSIDWASHTYGAATITGNSIAVNTASVSGTDHALSDLITYEEGEIYLVKLTLIDDAGDSDLPGTAFGGTTSTLNEWGIQWLSFRIHEDGSDEFDIFNTNGEKAVFTAVVEVYKIT